MHNGPVGKSFTPRKGKYIKKNGINRPLEAKSGSSAVA